MADSRHLGVDTVSKETFRAGMSRLGHAVSIVTTEGPAGRAGFTASSVCSVSDAPPTVLICLNRSSSVYEAFMGNKVLCINTLNCRQERLSTLFGGKTPMTERFAAAYWVSGLTGAPILEDAAAAFDCAIVDKVTAASHDILFCRVLDIIANSRATNLVYFDRKYHRIES
jgi:flavin reductase